MEDVSPAQSAAYPTEVYDILADESSIDVIRAIMRDHHLEEKAYEVLAPIQRLMVEGKLEPKNLSARFEERLKLPPEQARVLAHDVLQKLLRSLAPWIPAISSAMNETGVSPIVPAPVPDLPVPLTPMMFVERELEKFHLELPEPRVQDRFRTLLANFVAGSKPRAEVMDMLTRARKVGGLELDAAASEELLRGLEEEAKNTVIAKPLKPEVPVRLPPLPQPASAPVAPQKKFEAETIKPEDQSEVEAHKGRIPTHPPLHNIDEAMAEVVKVAKALALSEKEARQFSHIADTRLKDVRDAYATRRALEDEPVFGGLGLSGTRLSQALEIIEGAYSRLEQSAHETLRQQRDAYIRARQEKHLKPEIPEPDSSSLPAPVPSSPPPHASRGRVQDVAPPRRLSGPLEELATMGLADFRRLGANERESSDRIVQMLELLGEESYGKRLAGLQAWRKSPLTAQYISLLTQALRDHKSVADILAVHRKVGEDTLSLGEFQALVLLNGRLKI
ncbi:hypothetical protein HYW18_01095 [Candidatus Uhrbacteria bacterium]|nr:hypothetical protein [Candidatus Uhrbacteria bacterium]